MSFLLDTNVISEFAKPAPDNGVQKWLREHQDQNLYLSVLTIGELQQGIVRLPQSKKRTNLMAWLNDTVLVEYADFILPIDVDTMLHWGTLTGNLKQQDRNLSVMDGLIAATALKHHLELVTRNESDFADTGPVIINPWKD